MLLAKKISDDFPEESKDEYFNYHIKRYMFLIKILRKYSGHFPKRKLRLLAISPSYELELIKKYCGNLDISSLGLDTRFLTKEKRTVYDLNKIKNRESWPRLGKFDFVLMCEVIEHLELNAVDALNFLRNFLGNGGYLIVQTPNALCLDRRLQILFGANYYFIMEKLKKGSGHLKEYTIKEMEDSGNKAGLHADRFYIKNYFRSNSRIKLIKDILPGAFRDGMTIIYKK